MTDSMAVDSQNCFVNKKFTILYNPYGPYSPQQKALENYRLISKNYDLMCLADIPRHDINLLQVYHQDPTLFGNVQKHTLSHTFYEIIKDEYGKETIKEDIEEYNLWKEHKKLETDLEYYPTSYFGSISTIMKKALIQTANNSIQYDRVD